MFALNALLLSSYNQNNLNIFVFLIFFLVHLDASVLNSKTQTGKKSARTNAFFLSTYIGQHPFLGFIIHCTDYWCRNNFCNKDVHAGRAASQGRFIHSYLSLLA